MWSECCWRKHAPLTCGDLSQETVLRSQTPDDKRISVEFRLKQCPVDQEVCVCWVAFNGDLHHFYRLGNRECDLPDCHAEQAASNHAFVLFFKQGHERVADDIAAERLICSYRPNASNEQDLHRIEVEWEWGWPRVHVDTVAPAECEYRVLISPSERITLPSDCNWRIRYRFRCPPLPESFDKCTQTFYVWGDLDFDNYGPFGRNQTHDYQFNQIVPQVMIGRCLAESDSGFRPGWKLFDEWVIQAQYFWSHKDGTPYAHCGEIISVQPGEELCTTIDYLASVGAISVNMSAPNGRSSSIYLDRPFPDNASLYRSWSHFFHVAETASGTRGSFARPALNVEYKGQVNLTTLASVCPFEVLEASVPGCAGAWRSQLYSPTVGACSQLGEFHVSKACTLPA